MKTYQNWQHLTLIKESTRVLPSSTALSLPTVLSSPTLLFTSGMGTPCPESQTLPQAGEISAQRPFASLAAPAALFPPGRCFIQGLRVAADSVAKPLDASQHSTPVTTVEEVSQHASEAGKMSHKEPEVGKSELGEGKKSTIN